MIGHRSLGIACFGALVACSSAGSSEFGDDEAPVTTPKGEKPGTVVDDGTPTKPNDDGVACASTVNEAKRTELDIIFVIDNSGSMSEELTQVRTNINAFASSIATSGLDYRVVMVTTKGTGTDSGKLGGFGGLSLCVPAPLGGPDCGDNLPTFRHINTNVQSNDSLSIIVRDQAQIVSTLRPDSVKVFVEVTDDESQVPADQFINSLTSVAPQYFGTADKPRFIFNSIVGVETGSQGGSLGSGVCSSAVNGGLQYQILSQKTGGLIDSVCKTDYSSVLNNLAKNVASRVACDLKMPVASGAASDPSKVLVTFTDESGKASPLVRVTDVSKCASTPNGWYYDDNNKPSLIRLCTTTCSQVNSGKLAKVGIQLGCAVPEPK